MRKFSSVALCLAMWALAPAPPGFAQGEVFITGDARMGLAYDSSAEDRVQFVNRIRIHFHLRGQTDGGLGYGVGLGDRDSAGSATRGQSGTLSFGSALPPEQRRPQPLRWTPE